jgi:hypothetical protein
MLRMKSNCEHCNRLLPNESNEAMICTFGCTFCSECVQTILFNVCPNCGGGFEKRPSRPKSLLTKYPTDKDAYHKPVDLIAFKEKLEKYKNINPNKR